MNIVVDIETIPDQSKGAIERYYDDNVKCPFSTKSEIGADLNLSPDEVKYTSLGDLKIKWVGEKGDDHKSIAAKEKWLKTSLNGDYGQICCIGIKIGDNNIKTIHGDESLVLAEFWDHVNHDTKGREPYFIAHNAKFDLPFIYKRSVVNSVNTHARFLPHGRHGLNHYCTMEAWAGFGGRISLSNLAGILNLGQKEEGMSGSEVWPQYQAGNIEGIAKYCEQDVHLTSEIFNRLTFKSN